MGYIANSTFLLYYTFMSYESAPIWDKNFALTNEVMGAVADFYSLVQGDEAVRARMAAGQECRNQLGDFADDDLQLTLASKDPEQFTTALELDEVLMQLHDKTVSFVSRARIKEEQRLQKVQDHLITLDRRGAWKIYLLLSEPSEPPAVGDEYPDTWEVLPISGMANLRVVDQAEIASEQIGLTTTTYNYSPADLNQN